MVADVLVPEAQAPVAASSSDLYREAAAAVLDDFFKEIEAPKPPLPASPAVSVSPIEPVAKAPAAALPSTEPKAKIVKGLDAFIDKWSKVHAVQAHEARSQMPVAKPLEVKAQAQQNVLASPTD